MNEQEVKELEARLLGAFPAACFAADGELPRCNGNSLLEWATTACAVLACTLNTETMEWTPYGLSDDFKGDIAYLLAKAQEIGLR